MIRIVESRLAELKGRSFSELSRLAPYQGEKIKQDGKTLTISVWKDVINDAELRIVVQVYRHFWLGIGRMAANGFRIGQDGIIHELSQQEIYDFT